MPEELLLQGLVVPKSLLSPLGPLPSQAFWLRQASITTPEMPKPQLVSNSKDKNSSNKDFLFL
jgi:hypothetical protein